MSDFVMPSLGADMGAGTLVQWRKRLGEHIHRGEIIAEVETEKGVIEVECFSEGTLQSYLVEPGTKVPVGTRLATLSDGPQAVEGVHGEVEEKTESQPKRALERASEERLAVHATPAARRKLRALGISAEELAASAREPVITGHSAKAWAAPPASAPSPTASSDRGGPSQASPPVSPLARQRANEQGLSLHGIAPTGPFGSIVARDVEAALRERHSSGAQEKGAEGSPMRRAIAAAMTHSKQEIPHYYLSHLVDVQSLMDWLHAENARRLPPERLLAGVCFVRAVARAVRKTPELNATFVDGRITLLQHVNVGVAVSLRQGGLVAPAIIDADKRSVDELSTAFKDVISRARSGSLRSSEMNQASITVTSLGERGVDSVFPIIIPPQVAMVGMGTIVVRPMVVADKVVPRSTVTITLAADHRVSDGHRGALFLSALARILEETPTS